MDFKVNFNRRRVKRALLVADLKRVAAKLKTKVLTMTLYQNHGKYSTTVIYNRFGSWISALQVAGLKSPRLVFPTPEQMLCNIRDVWKKLKRQPSHKLMKPPLSKFSGYSYVAVFGSWGKALRMFDLYMKDKKKYKETMKPIRRRFCGRAISAALRLEILSRDKHRCKNCGRSPAKDSGVKLSIDHIKPLSSGGKTIPSNLQTLCLDCNVKKGTK